MDGERLRYWRLVRGMTQRDLADRAGTTHAAISHIEAGKRQPRPSMILKLAEALGVKPEELLRGITETSSE